MRAFIALELPDEFVYQTAELARYLSESIQGRFIPRSNYHLTLAFLGEVAEKDIASAITAMEDACEGIAAIPLISDGLGTFGKNRDATLWLGLKLVPDLENLTTRLREGLIERDVLVDSKTFKPHITLARHAKIPRGEDLIPPFPQDSEATKLTLYMSKLGREGAEYKELHSIVQ